MSGIQFGIDRLLASPELVTGRVGLVTNDAARTARDSELHSRVALQRAGLNLVRLFSPEHGIAASAAGLAKIVFFVAIVFAVITFAAGVRRK